MDLLETAIAALSPLRRAALLRAHGLFKQADSFDFIKSSGCPKLLSRYNVSKTINQLYLEELRLFCRFANVPFGREKAKLIKNLEQKIKSKESLINPTSKECNKLIRSLEEEKTTPITTICKTLKIDVEAATNWLKSQNLYSKYCYRNNPPLKKHFQEKTNARLFNKFFRLVKHFRKSENNIEDFCNNKNLTPSKFVRINRKLVPLVKQFVKDKKTSNLDKQDWEGILATWYKGTYKDLVNFCKTENISITQMLVFLSRTKE